jgi:CheY-like chemotaxis protein
VPKILIVDNDRATVALLKILLELDGHTVAVAGSPNTVLDEVRQAAPDVVLMDVFLTGGDGLDLLRSIRREADLSTVPVVMTSGMSLGEECAAAGADGFLLKPYAPEQLTEILRKTLDSRGKGTA